MEITFKPLNETDLPLLLKWLETPHVKAWWDQDIKWTPALIREKFGDYVKGYKLENGVPKTIYATIICVDDQPIGYIQFYNAHDFSRSKPLTGLPSSLAAFDIFIGEANYINQGIGSKAIVQFLKKYAGSYTHVFADPESTNLAAIRAYEKAGFKKINEQPDTGEVWMIRENITKIIYLIGKPGSGKYTIAQELAKAGFIVCDNQLINNPIFTLLNYDGFSKIPEIGWDAIANIRRAVFDFISIEYNNNYVLTNCLYENEGDRNCYSQVEAMALKRGSLFVPVKLLISEEENLRRITEPSRRARWKSIDPQDVYQIEPLIEIKHPHLLELDVSQLSAAQISKQILEYVSQLINKSGLFSDEFASDTLSESKQAGDAAVPELIHQLELSLLERSVRQSSDQLNKLIADDFLEFGCSGKVYNKQNCLEQEEVSRQFVVNNLKVKELSKQVMLTTYETIEDGAVSLRSSVWKLNDGRWQMIFHQGTKVQEGDKMGINNNA